MNTATILAVAALAVILGLSIGYIYREKKKGTVCIGCPCCSGSGSGCPGCSGNSSGCSCSTH